MAQKPSQITASRATQFIKRPFKKIFIKPSLFLAFTQQPQLSYPTSHQDVSFAQQTSFSQHQEPASLSPQQPASFSHRQPSPSASQLIWGYSDECSSSSSPQLSCFITQLSKSSTTQPFSLFDDEFQTASHHQFQPLPFETPVRKPSVTMSGSRSRPFERTGDFKRLSAHEKARAFINHFIFEEDDEHEEWESKRDIIRINCNLTWDELVNFSNFGKGEGTSKCQKIVQAPVIGEKICCKLWYRLAEIARGEAYTEDLSNHDKVRRDTVVEDKARATQRLKEEEERRAKEKEEKKKAKKAARQTSGSTFSKMLPKRKTEPEAEKKEGGGEPEAKDEEPFWQPAESNTPQRSPREIPQDTPTKDLDILEGDWDALERLANWTPEEKEARRRVILADELAAKEREARQRAAAEREARQWAAEERQALQRAAEERQARQRAAEERQARQRAAEEANATPEEKAARRRVVFADELTAEEREARQRAEEEAKATPEEKAARRRVVFADELTAEEREARQRAEEATAAEEDKGDAADENAENEVEAGPSSSRPKNPRTSSLTKIFSKKSTEGREESDSSAKTLFRSRSLGSKASKLGPKTSSFGLKMAGGLGAGLPYRPIDPKDPKDNHPRKRSV